jgi:hypothetical protein
VIKSKEMRCRHHTWEMKNSYTIFIRKPEVRDNLKDLGIYGRRILIIKTKCECWPVASSCKYGNEP